MGQHSILSASASHRWLHCTPSVQFVKDLPNEGSVYAEEGTRAHELCAYKLSEYAKVHLKSYRGNVPKPEHEYDQATQDCADDYVAFCAEHMTDRSMLFIELHVDYSAYTCEGSFGTADCVIVDDGRITIIDYKHGVGVPVECRNNSQLMLYALGAYDFARLLCDIDTVSMSIFQPRINNISTFEMSIKDLLKVAEEEFKPKAKMALNGEGKFTCGSWCRFCPGRVICRKRAEEMVREDFGLPPALSTEEVAELLPKVELIKQWCSDLEDWALNAALQGTHISGFKLVEGRSVRTYKDPDAVAEAVRGAGFNPYQEPKLLGITDMTRLLGKKRFETLLSDLIIKPQGKPTLVPESDKRPAISQVNDDFNVYPEEK